MERKVRAFGKGGWATFESLDSFVGETLTEFEKEIQEKGYLRVGTASIQFTGDDGPGKNFSIVIRAVYVGKRKSFEMNPLPEMPLIFNQSNQ